jgi:hypothetical protein
MPAGFDFAPDQLDFANELGLPVLIPAKRLLAAKFGVPPFSILNAREGWWQERKTAWISLGIQSELGRGDTAGSKLTMSDTLEREKPGSDQARTSAKRSTSARCFGQDLMRGEYVVGSAKANNACQPHHGHDPGPGRPPGEPCNGGDAWVSSGEQTGTSIFDPVLCELCYRWFCPPGGRILDPFAGGSVRGIVAAVLGFQYIGIELRSEQIAANQEQARTICSADMPMPEWLEGDATALDAVVRGRRFDFVFTCPPYGDLEIYSDNPADLSTMMWPQFCEAHAAVINLAIRFLMPDRFAAWVVGDFRDANGYYRAFPEKTVEQFHLAGARKYNEAILITAVGSLALRVSKQFEVARKLGKTHQNVLVFAKGDPEHASKRANGI